MTAEKPFFFCQTLQNGDFGGEDAFAMGLSGIGASSWHLPTGGDTIHMAAAVAAVTVTPRRGETEAGAVKRALARHGGNAALYKEKASLAESPHRGWVRAEDTGVFGGGCHRRRGRSCPRGGPGGRARLAAPVPASKAPCQAHSADARLEVPVPGSQHPCQARNTHSRCGPLVPPSQHLCQPCGTLSGLSAPAPGLYCPYRADSARARMAAPVTGS